MVPKELFRGQKTIGGTFILVFVAGMNFYSLINCMYCSLISVAGSLKLIISVFPLTFADVYTPDPIQVSLKGPGYGISVTLGATVFNALLSLFKNYNRELMIIACVIMSKFQKSLEDSVGLIIFSSLRRSTCGHYA